MSEGWKKATEISGAVVAAAAYLFVGGGSILWARYAALDLPATTVVSTLPRDQLFATGLTSMVVPLLVSCAPVAVLIALGKLGTAKRAALAFAAALSATVVLEGLATRDGIAEGSARTIVAIATIVVVVGAAGLVIWKEKPWLGFSIVLVALATASVFSSDAIVPAIVVGVLGATLLALSAVMDDAERGKSRAAWIGVAIVAGAVLAVRLLFEFQSPAPLPPSAVYAEATRDCVKPKEGTAARCVTVGYLLAQDENKVLIAAVDGGRRTGDVRRAKCLRTVSGLLVVLPTKAVVEAQVLGREQVAAQAAEPRITLLDQVIGVDEADVTPPAC